ncbi:MAG: hypothetical protein BGO98_32265 [Myxococcales bacterium 68-20]|nr:MAG: hypothetical protein BGO98_32265 [Myxococcales bacterium 68-20]
MASGSSDQAPAIIGLAVHRDLGAIHVTMRSATLLARSPQSLLLDARSQQQAIRALAEQEPHPIPSG